MSRNGFAVAVSTLVVAGGLVAAFGSSDAPKPDARSREPWDGSQCSSAFRSGGTLDFTHPVGLDEAMKAAERVVTAGGSRKLTSLVIGRTPTKVSINYYDGDRTVGAASLNANGPGWDVSTGECAEGPT